MGIFGKKLNIFKIIEDQEDYLNKLSEEFEGENDLLGVISAHFRTTTKSTSVPESAKKKLNELIDEVNELKKEIEKQRIWLIDKAKGSDEEDVAIPVFEDLKDHGTDSQLISLNDDINIKTAEVNEKLKELLEILKNLEDLPEEVATAAVLDATTDEGMMDLLEEGEEEEGDEELDKFMNELFGNPPEPTSVEEDIEMFDLLEEPVMKEKEFKDSMGSGTKITRFAKIMKFLQSAADKYNAKKYQDYLSRISKITSLIGKYKNKLNSREYKQFTSQLGDILYKSTIRFIRLASENKLDSSYADHSYKLLKILENKGFLEISNRIHELYALRYAKEIIPEKGEDIRETLDEMGNLGQQRDSKPIIQFPNQKSQTETERREDINILKGGRPPLKERIKATIQFPKSKVQQTEGVAKYNEIKKKIEGARDEVLDGRYSSAVHVYASVIEELNKIYDKRWHEELFDKEIVQLYQETSNDLTSICLILMDKIQDKDDPVIGILKTASLTLYKLPKQFHNEGMEDILRLVGKLLNSEDVEQVQEEIEEIPILEEIKENAKELGWEPIKATRKPNLTKLKGITQATNIIARLIRDSRGASTPKEMINMIFNSDFKRNIKLLDNNKKIIKASFKTWVTFLDKSYSLLKGGKATRGRKKIKFKNLNKSLELVRLTGAISSLKEISTFNGKTTVFSKPIQQLSVAFTGISQSAKGKDVKSIQKTGTLIASLMLRFYRDQNYPDTRVIEKAPDKFGKEISNISELRVQAKDWLQKQGSIALYETILKESLPELIDKFGDSFKEDAKAQKKEILEELETEAQKKVDSLLKEGDEHAADQIATDCEKLNIYLSLDKSQLREYVLKGNNNEEVFKDAKKELMSKFRETTYIEISQILDEVIIRVKDKNKIDELTKIIDFWIKESLEKANRSKGKGRDRGMKSLVMLYIIINKTEEFKKHIEITEITKSVKNIIKNESQSIGKRILGDYFGI